MSVKIKICGITNLDDALRAAELGADALGFIFHPRSPRFIRVRDAARICQKLPPLVARVGVFVDQRAREVDKARRDCRLTALQFHGDESPSFCARFAAPSIKAIRVRDEQSLRAAGEYDVDALLLDTYTATARGGTGQSFDWSLAVKAKKILAPPLILSGGLTPDNVGEAIRRVRPYAVDVASGVEGEPGRKDPGKLRRFIETVKGVVE